MIDKCFVCLFHSVASGKRSYHEYNWRILLLDITVYVEDKWSASSVPVRQLEDMRVIEYAFDRLSDLEDLRPFFKVLQPLTRMPLLCQLYLRF